ncbi:hypothetical protein K439DRAFT_1346092 [Ramaria rubella]|nr:hypothetical protein K439DRAFT_1346092 [Ramaria rubella]
MSSSAQTDSPQNATQSKKSNPLTDLVDSEREYIELLAGIIRKVAGAWSRTNFPPKQLDAMFRGIESVYKANRGLLTKLKEIGPTPTSPKALGDLLMRWIDDLDAPYTKYCTNYAAGFDVWQPILDNTRLPPILAALSSVHPPPSSRLPASPTISESRNAHMWTLDALFALPRARLKYYKKLYIRLLKSTQPGRSDHKLLTGAVEKLEMLLGMLTERDAIIIGRGENTNIVVTSLPPLSSFPVQPEGTSCLDQKERDGPDRVVFNGCSSKEGDDQTRSVERSVPLNSMSSEGFSSAPTSGDSTLSRVTSSATMSMPISNLERRLSTERVLDIFTLKPKHVRLQMNPPSLPFTRCLRLSHNVEVHFTPRATPESPHIHVNGHIFLLTDLFLVCERMTTNERQTANAAGDGQDYDMWLLYPPLAGKHLRVSGCPDQDNVVQVQVLKKEIIFLHADSKVGRDILIKEFRECIEAANLLSPRAGQPPPPPVPDLSRSPHSLTDISSRDHEPRKSPQTATPTALSPLSAPILNPSPNPSPQPYDLNRPFSDVVDSLSQTTPNSNRVDADLALPPLASEETSPPNTTTGSSKMEGGRMLTQSVSQPQFHPSVASASSNQMQRVLSPVSLSASAPFFLFPQGTNNTQDHTTGHVRPPARPSTAPSQEPHRHQTPRLQHPHQMNTTSSYQSPPSDERLARTGRPPSDPIAAMHLRKSPSAISLGSVHRQANGHPPPIPGHSGAFDSSQTSNGFLPRDASVNYTPVSHVHQPFPRPALPPSATFSQRTASFATTTSWTQSTGEPSPPSSPVDDNRLPSGPVTSTITAQFKCKVFLQLHHGQWKSLGGARLKLYLQQPTNIKQLVVEAESKDKAMMISTIILTDGVERVGKTGVAIELSDKGARTGIVYMIQLRNETSASGLFDSLLAGSDRTAGRAGKG